MLNLYIAGDKQTIANLKKQSKSITNIVLNEMKIQMFKLQRHVQQDKLQGQVLFHRSGRLSSGIKNTSFAVKSFVTGMVYTNVEYAAIHEYGGVILPRLKDYLRFKIGDKWVTTKRVNMPEKSFMRSALKDYEPMIVQSIQDALYKGLTR
jgi:phage gpG-like protein